MSVEEPGRAIVSARRSGEGSAGSRSENCTSRAGVGSARAVAKTPKVVAKGMRPSSAIPTATKSMFCPCTPRLSAPGAATLGKETIAVDRTGLNAGTRLPGGRGAGV